ncbi:hypothetical protein KM043_012890 [Ampulex compressa]|nr:hypothetical protein KM043_012890 [Ampulex compressa]
MQPILLRMHGEQTSHNESSWREEAKHVIQQNSPPDTNHSRAASYRPAQPRGRSTETGPSGRLSSARSVSLAPSAVGVGFVAGVGMRAHAPLLRPAHNRTGSAAVRRQLRRSRRPVSSDQTGKEKKQEEIKEEAMQRAQNRKQEELD